jgi:hypothetical protein
MFLPGSVGVEREFLGLSLNLTSKLLKKNPRRQEDNYNYAATKYVPLFSTKLPPFQMIKILN